MGAIRRRVLAFLGSWGVLPLVPRLATDQQQERLLVPGAGVLSFALPFPLAHDVVVRIERTLDAAGLPWVTATRTPVSAQATPTRAATFTATSVSVQRTPTTPTRTPTPTAQATGTATVTATRTSTSTSTSAQATPSRTPSPTRTPRGNRIGQRREEP